MTIAPSWVFAWAALLIPVGVWLLMLAFQERDGKIYIPVGVAFVVWGVMGPLKSPLRPGSRIVVSREGVRVGGRLYPAAEVTHIEALEGAASAPNDARRFWLLSIGVKHAPPIERVMTVGEPGALPRVVAAMHAVLQEASGGAPTGAAAVTGAPSRDRAGWQGRLFAYVRERHAARPIPTREGLDPLQQAMYGVEGGFLTTWLRQYGPQMLAERRMLLEQHGELAPDPVIVIHGDLPAVAAVLQIAGEPATTGEKRLVVLLDEEYRAFIREHPEAREFDFHVASWSRFEPARPELLERARAIGHAIDPALQYFNHINGTLWGPRHGLEVENLWSWDETRLDLVEEAITHKRF